MLIKNYLTAVPRLRGAILCGVLMVGGVLSGAVHGGEVEGFTEPYRDIDVPAMESGVIERLTVHEGDHVTVGQELGALDLDVLKATLEIADVSRKAMGKLVSAQAESRMHAERLEKLKVLLERNHATQEEIDRTAIDKEVAEARVQIAQEELKIRELEHKRIEVQIEQRIFRSPIDGVVTRLQKDAGEFVSPNDPVILNVVQLDPLMAVFAVPSGAAEKLKSNASVAVTVGASGAKLSGVVELVSPIIDAQSGTVMVKVRVPNSKGDFRSGERCLLTIEGVGPINRTVDATAKVPVSTTSQRPVSR
ncbi:MAG: efflux RND transporter periplasmic adaptor subunit [Planctomycetaceae bacterium]